MPLERRRARSTSAPELLRVLGGRLRSYAVISIAWTLPSTPSQTRAAVTACCEIGTGSATRRVYYRPPGGKMIRLRATIDTQEFLDEYRRARDGAPPVSSKSASAVPAAK